MFYEPGRTEHNLPHDPFKACVVPRPIGWISTVSPPQSTSTSTSTSTSKSTSTSTGTAASGDDHVQRTNTPTPTPTDNTDNTVIDDDKQTQSQTRANLAPYSQFNNLTFDPPYVMFSANQTAQGTRKDTVRNAEATGVFCWQLATWPLREAVNTTAEQLPYGVDEFEHAGLTKVYSRVLRPAVPMVAESPVRFECEYHSTLRLPANPPMGTVDVVIGKVVGVHVDESVLTDGKIDVGKTQPIARCGYYQYAVVRDTFDMIIPGDPASLLGLEGSVKKHREHREAAQGMGGSEPKP
ncbi:hypothetical protein A1O3_09284 [Capronia epimyces CBS 606.96]|uniref:Flavin reductase like domain-containing protein n=1 Tax=Capronia epimyces CBS 606.96 TaxID=1182542 RepID=W9XD32_9EURO|nr:uncharacterized protein A1O3_09284 [Capronia epimyces CBS 606.96]EXJ78123.1 hypothetical protein A1O3_09284 [Capronia epimyces CBS 606.96]